jgi:mannan endo-1,4-beta-mannosidase
MPLSEEFHVRRIRALPYALATALLLLAGLAVWSAGPARAATGFVSTDGTSFSVDGAPFRFGGVTNYYLHYSSPTMVNDVFEDAAAMGVTVLRAWTFLECGGDKPNSNGGCSAGPDHWMQKWSNAANGGAGGVIYNDTGAGGLVQLDKAIAAAAAHHIRLILPFTNNWRDFGGMDQYVTWYGLADHDQFYTDARIRKDYQNWIAHLLNRTNTVTGVAYRNDPTIFAWELANEPRCIDASLPTSGTCTPATLKEWVSTMSAFVKGVDANHMVSVGDEGFLNRNGNGNNSFPYTQADGVDHEQLTSVSTVDFGTYHMYPQAWGQSPVQQWGTGWITDHDAAGRTMNKPEILEEFGSTDQSTRDATYAAWTDAVRTTGGAGFMVWLLTGIQDDGQLYPDFDGYRVVVPSSTATVLTDAGSAISGNPPPTSTPPTSTPPTSPPPPPPPGGCTVTYKVSNQWDTGFQGDVSVRNDGSAAVNGWTLAWSYADGQAITQSWNSSFTQSAAAVTVTNASWNGTLAPAGTASFGFLANWSGANHVPAAFTLNGTACVLG